MMTREEIKEIVDYSQEHGITVKRRLQELNVPESNFSWFEHQADPGIRVWRNECLHASSSALVPDFNDSK